MKKKIILALAILSSIIYVGCSTTIKTDPDEFNYSNFWDQFTIIEERFNGDYGSLYIVYDNDTKVMYYLNNDYHYSFMTPIYEADGSVRVYDGK